jgi:hypothetical protein
MMLSMKKDKMPCPLDESHAAPHLIEQIGDAVTSMFMIKYEIC